ncbi:MAG: IS1595 family transposase [Betaproteobacteria bacterium]|nr:IS1595 family transposase [Betaproteobacteria bacterium]
MKLRRSRLSSAQTRRLLEHFVAGTPARTAAELVQVNRNTATHFYHRLREVIAVRLAHAGPSGSRGEVEVHESYLGSARKGQKGRTPKGSAPVFGMLTRGGEIHTVMVPNTRQDTLLPILRTRINPESLVYTNALHVSDALNRLGVRHRKVAPRDRFAPGPAHMNGIENFWNQARRHLRKYNGIPSHHLHLYLKECEWRFNYGSAGQLLKTLEHWLIQEQ